MNCLASETVKSASAATTKTDRVLEIIVGGGWAGEEIEKRLSGYERNELNKGLGRSRR